MTIFDWLHENFVTYLIGYMRTLLHIQVVAVLEFGSTFLILIGGTARTYPNAHRYFDICGCGTVHSHIYCKIATQPQTLIRACMQNGD